MLRILYNLCNNILELSFILAKINSSELSSQERQELLHQLDQDSSYEGLKSAANLLYVKQRA